MKRNTQIICKHNFINALILALAIILMGLLSVTLYFENASAATNKVYTSGTWQWSINSDNSVTIVRYTGTATTVTIPSTMNGYKVSTIGSEVFKTNKDSIKSVTISKGISIINLSAFENCTNLSYINLPEGITEIKNKAFYGCKNLTSITFPSTIKTLGTSSFANCTSLKNVNFPKTVDDSFKMYAYAFSNCSSLKSIILPYKLKNVYKYTFQNCKSLKNVVVNSSETTFDDLAFSGITDLCIICPTTKSQAFHYVYKMDYNWALKSEVFPGTIESFMSKTVMITEKSVTLTWFQNTKATGYSIEQYSNGSWIPVKTITGNSTTNCSITGLKASTTYNFRIRAFNSFNGINYYGSYSSINVTTKPTAITNLKVKSCTATEIALSWDKNTTATHYCIYVDSKIKYIINDNSITEYKLTNLSPAEYYTIEVRAYNSNSSVPLEGTGATVGTYTLPTTVTGFTFSARTSSSITLIWKKNTIASGYIIEQYKNNQWVKIKDIAADGTLNYKVTGLTANTSYKFRIRAYTKRGKTTLNSSYVEKTFKTVS